MSKEPKQFSETVVDGKVFGIYEREEKHNLGSANGCPDNWWLKYEYTYGKDEEPTEPRVF